jgi:hypothetical protein
VVQFGPNAPQIKADKRQTVPLPARIQNPWRARMPSQALRQAEWWQTGGAGPPPRQSASVYRWVGDCCRQQFRLSMARRLSTVMAEFPVAPTKPKPKIQQSGSRRSS